MTIKAHPYVLITLAVIMVGGLVLGTPARAAGVSAANNEPIRTFGPRAPAAGSLMARGHVVVGLQSGSAADAAIRTMTDQGYVVESQTRHSAARIVDVGPGQEIEAARRLGQLPGVQYAEPDYAVTASGPRAPTDALYAEKQWDLPKIEMPDAWGITIGDSTVRVAVLDSGLALSHVDLANQWTYAPGHSDREHVFLTPPLSSGCSAPTSPIDDDGHGTHVSGTVGAASSLSGAQPVGVAGIAPGARIVPVKVLDCQGNGNLSDVADAIDFAAQSGVSIINMSFGGTIATGCPTYLQAAITRALAAGVFIAAAAGNDGTTAIQYPAGCTGVFGVGATTTTDTHATFSNSNSSVALSAPGVAITSTWKDGGYAVAEGTSMATPHVAGCAALMRSANPLLSGTMVRSLLQSTAVDLGTPGYDTAFGWGRLSCGAAVAAAAPNQGSPTPTIPVGLGLAGGKGLSISSDAGRVTLSWLSGVGQTGYSVARLTNGVVTLLPVGGLEAGATSFADSPAPSGLDCYALFVLGTTPQGQSDLECGVVGFGSGSGAPRSFALKLNQSTTASLSWSAPASGTPDSYLLVTLGGAAQTLPATTTTASLPISGLTCYAIGSVKNGALVGYTDLLCGVPGFSNIGAASSTSQ